MIEEIRIKTSVEDDMLTGNLEVTVLAEHESAQGRFLWAYTADREGAEADRIFPVPVERQIQFCMQIRDVRLWNAETVYLYDLILEIRDKENNVLERTAKKIAFYRSRLENGAYLVNGKEILLRPVLLREDSEAFWKACKLSFCNAVVAPDTCGCGRCKEHCLEYGLYMLTWEEWKQISECRGLKLCVMENMPGPEKNPDFELNVVQQGVLIENKCIFQNVSDYTIECIVCKEENGGRQVRICSMEADIPPGSSRYIEYPFEPLEEAGKYIYRVRLIRKRDTAWGSQGDSAAEGEAVIMNFFGI
ncbi:MAG: DUF4981 domain-containing protein [Eubacteriales bacterium]|nr:DUF4981 domain-containing protein [Eubacteriales bacterium]